MFQFNHRNTASPRAYLQIASKAFLSAKAFKNVWNSSLSAFNRFDIMASAWKRILYITGKSFSQQQSDFFRNFLLIFIVIMRHCRQNPGGGDINVSGYSGFVRSYLNTPAGMGTRTSRPYM
jgi:hypothetical protein